MINAGGIISVAHEYAGGVTEAQVTAEISEIPAWLTEFFERHHKRTVERYLAVA